MKRLGDKAVVLGVNNDEDPGAALRLMASQNMTWRSWKTGGADNAINQRWSANSWPRTYVIDAHGIIRFANVAGPYLDHAVTTLIAEAEKKR